MRDSIAQHIKNMQIWHKISTPCQWNWRNKNAIWWTNPTPTNNL